jgi:hypothetical protein
MYRDNQTIFSYSPCKFFNEESKKGFSRVTFPYVDLGGFEFSSNPTGIKILNSGSEYTEHIWNAITQQVIEQGFHLGIHFQEPKNLN